MGGFLGRKEKILFTEDGGTTWYNVTPPEPVIVGVSPRQFMIGYFLDSDHAWVRNSHSTRVWRTTDGGQTWTASELLGIDQFYPAEIFPQSIYFIDPDHGWVMFYLESGMSHEWVYLYRTSDGGLTWERLFEPGSVTDLSSCCKTGMVFYDQNTGLVTYEPGPYYEPHVSWTHDGGYTWTYQTLPTPFEDPDLVQNSYCITHTATLFSPEVATLGLECRINFDRDNTISFVYSTEDGGENWSSMPNPGNSIQFFTPTVGFSFGEDLYKTENGGQTWEFVSSLDWAAQISFVDQLHGWAVVEIEEDYSLFHTSDGGYTWDQIDPKAIY
jgi:photosystem II stability/assembly factor-like uncharacterized protein